MQKGRLEAFSDGVIAIIITIMVLELRPPLGTSLASLRPLLSMFACYILSFIFLGIYWTNHHHLLQAAKHVGGNVLWANLHLLFWLSLVPFVTDWIGQNPVARAPVILYGIVLLMAGAAYWVLAHCLIERHGKDSLIAKALGRDFKGSISVVIYAVSIASTFLDPRLAYIGYVGVAIMWIVPDKRIERIIAGNTSLND